MANISLRTYPATHGVCSRPWPVPPGLRPQARPGRASGRGRSRWHRPFLEGLARGGLAAALAEAGIGFGEAVSERARDSCFRQETDRVGIERLASAELMIIDWLIEQLKAPSEGREKSILSLWQALKDEKRRPTGPAEAAKPSGRKPRHAISPERAAAAERSIARAAELDRLLAVVKERLDAAEQQDPKP